MPNFETWKILVFSCLYNFARFTLYTIKRSTKMDENGLVLESRFGPGVLTRTLRGAGSSRSRGVVLPLDPIWFWRGNLPGKFRPYEGIWRYLMIPDTCLDEIDKLFSSSLVHSGLQLVPNDFFVRQGQPERLLIQRLHISWLQAPRFFDFFVISLACALRWRTMNLSITGRRHTRRCLSLSSQATLMT